MALLNHPAFYAAVFTVTIFLLLYWRLTPFLELLGSRNKRYILIADAVLLLANAAVLTVGYSDAAMSPEQAIFLFKIDVIVIYLLSLIAYLFALKNRKREAMFSYGIVGIFGITLLSVGLFIINNYVTAVRGLLRLEILCGIIFLLAAICHVFVVRLLRHTIRLFHSEHTIDYWKNLWIIPNLMLIAEIIVVPMDQFLSTPMQLVSRLLIACVALQICRSVVYDHASYSHRLNLQAQIDAQREYYTAQAKKLQFDRKARHDFLHQLSAICAMADNNDPEGLKDYCHQLMNISRSDTIPYTGNAAVDGVLYRYTERAKANGVTLTVRGHFQPRFKEEIDVCVVLGNALENAVCAAATAPHDRFVDVELLQEAKLLTVTVRNSFDGVVQVEEDTILSRKRDHEAGIGLASMSSLCAAHGGTMSVHYDDTTFTVMMLMNIENE